MTDEERAERKRQQRRAQYERDKAKPGWVESQREYYREYDATKRVRDADAKRDYMREYQQNRRAADPKFAERGREASRKYYANNADQERAKRRAYSQTPEAKEKAKLYARKWRAANPDKSRRTAWKQRGDGTKDEYRYSLILLNDPCSYCGGPGGEIDHITPIKAGGKTTWDNLTSACNFCNRSKRDRSLLTHLLRSRAAA